LYFTNNSGDGNDALILEQNKSGGVMWRCIINFTSVYEY
jgi:hypothetical protein